MMINKRTSIFLLGGHDLEMDTIKSLLLHYYFQVEDRNLTWSNARLSAYEDIIRNSDPGREIIGVELTDDIGLDNPRYIRIDHHNDLYMSNSSLEQIADLLGHTLSYDGMLIAANDKGYIPAMMAMGASQEEINDIRRRDRKAQGVTEKDEALAEQSIREHLVQNGEITVVLSLTDRFSTICDRLYPYSRLLIYTPFEWTFYGEGKTDLTEELKEEISARRIYHGGGDIGFIGAAKGAYKTEEIYEFVYNIKRRYEQL